MVANILPDSLRHSSAAEEGFEFLPRMVLIVGRQGDVIAINQLMRARLGLNIDTPVPRGLQIEAVFNGDRSRLMKDIFAGASGGRLGFRVRDPQGGGDARTSFEITPLREGRKVLRFLMTEHIQRPIPQAFESLNARVRRANEAAAEARRRHRHLQESYESLEQFSYVAAHDLQAPLRNIAALISIVEEDHAQTLPEDAADLLGSARGVADRLQVLINDLLAHARSSASELDLQRVALTPLLETVLRNLGATLTETRARIDMPPDLGEVTADPVMLRQLLDNLLGNAIKYRQPDRPLVVTLRRLPGEDETDCLQIRDNGLGFDNALKDRLFAPFQRLHADTEIPGTGIGLATCRTICERHGWTLDAEGKPGDGACFRIAGLT